MAATRQHRAKAVSVPAAVVAVGSKASHARKAASLRATSLRANLNKACLSKACLSKTTGVAGSFRSGDNPFAAAGLETLRAGSIFPS